MKNASEFIEVHNLILLDESASMQKLHKAAVDSVNDTLSAILHCQEKLKQVQKVSLFTFNGIGTRMHLFDENILTANSFKYDQYKPNSTTPLMDCIGQTIGLLKARQNQHHRNENVIVTILTDGSENGSKKYCKKSVSRLIAAMKSIGWIFNYVGANHDVAKACNSLNINNYYQFEATPTDLTHTMAIERMARLKYYESWSANPMSPELTIAA